MQAAVADQRAGRLETNRQHTEAVTLVLQDAVVQFGGALLACARVAWVEMPDVGMDVKRGVQGVQVVGSERSNL